MYKKVHLLFKQHGSWTGKCISMKLAKTVGARSKTELYIFHLFTHSSIFNKYQLIGGNQYMHGFCAFTSFKRLFTFIKCFFSHPKYLGNLVESQTNLMDRMIINLF